jgi:hypothetical protein
MKRLLAYDEHDRPYAVPEAAQWEIGGLVVREDGSAIGVAILLFDAEGKPIAGAMLTPEQAVQQGRFLIENAERMQSAYKEMAEVAVPTLKG